MSKKPSSPPLNERAQYLLRVLIERYIRDGEPVGSRTLARDAAMELSPATIRNVMADLEDLGFVKSPHTSAGRMPTVQGYRFFVDSLLTVQPLDGVDMQRLRTELNLDLNRKDLVERASNLLSGITRMAGVVMLPRRKQAALRRIDFLPLSDKRVLVIMVINEREVQNRIIHVNRAYTTAELEVAAAFLNEQFGGKDLAAVRDVIVADMQQTHEDMNRMMKAAVEMAGQVFRADDLQEREDVVFAGQTNLMGFRELCEVDTLRHLFEAFNQKREILHLLDQCVNAEGVQIFIGEESGYTALDECSVVTAPYSVDGKVVGVLGVIGPTRMAYDRVIPIVDTTARLLGAALNPRE
ncbi:MAG: heat-inducible transcriptional repressor HrcA [Gammaproteobacteria bacterium]|nr:heat-inducible transcriptional repressor HrcA [Gammaproteobacteria bacterium]